MLEWSAQKNNHDSTQENQLSGDFKTIVQLPQHPWNIRSDGEAETAADEDSKDEGNDGYYSSDFISIARVLR